MEAVNAGLGNRKIDIMEQPDNIVAHVNHVWCNIGPDLPMLYLQYAVALLIILLVPSLNLCGLSSSRMQQRMAELGVRKAFGGTRWVLVRQILNENLMLTLLGGVAGLLLSYLSVYLMREWLFTGSGNVGTLRRVQSQHGRTVQPVDIPAGFRLLCGYQPDECGASGMAGGKAFHCRIFER